MSETPTHVYDLLGIGLGPFNLGLACLAAPLDDLDAVFLEQAEEFDWHPGLMIDGATIQVPFMADLVTMADPTSPYSFLNYLKQSGRLYRFYIREDMYPLRSEYNAYCRWAAQRVPGIRFGHRVVRVSWVASGPDAAEQDGAGHYVVEARRKNGARAVFAARRLVLGIGTEPRFPAGLSPAVLALPDSGQNGHPSCMIHSADYLSYRDRLRESRSITVIGSGQSAAEIYRDLLEGIHGGGYRLDWVTRSPRFFPMEYTKLTLELTSPEYTSYFHALPAAQRETLLRDQRALYKGISSDLVNEIFDTLYRLELDGHGRPRPLPTRLITCTEVAGLQRDDAGAGYRLDLRHWETGEVTSTTSDSLVFATGYAPRVPSFLEPVRERIRWDAQGRFDVARDYTVDLAGQEIYVQNAEEHTHGLSAPDLGMGPYRNSVILARVLGREVYPVEQRIAFQSFGLDGLAEPSGAFGPVARAEVHS